LRTTTTTRRRRRRMMTMRSFRNLNRMLKGSLMKAVLRMMSWVKAARRMRS
jgi:hypothetical protein